MHSLDATVENKKCVLYQRLDLMILVPDRHYGYGCHCSSTYN